MKTRLIKLTTQYFKNLIFRGKTESPSIIAWGLLFSLFCAVLFVFKPTLLQSLDFKTYDLFLRHLPNNHSKIKPIIVDIDEKSLVRYGQWPWPRYKISRLFDKIALMDPSVISIDMIFSEPDRTSAGRLLKELEDSYSLENLRIDKLPDEFIDNDFILAQTLTKGPFVLGAQFHFNNFVQPLEPCALKPVQVAFMQNSNGSREEFNQIPQSSGVLCNLKIFSEKVSTSGFFNFSPDSDGMLRRLPMVIQHNEHIYVSLALATVLKFKGTNSIIIKKNGDQLQTISFKDICVPVDSHGQFLVKFRGFKRSYDHISAADIIDDKVPSEQIKGKIVFVGTSAAGLKEFRTTPFDPVFPGVEVHATVVDNILSGDFIAIPGFNNILIVIIILLTGTLLSFFIALRSATSGFIAMLLFVVGLLSGTQQLFFHMGLFIGVIFPVSFIVCNYVFLTFLKYRLEERKILLGMQELLLTQDITIESMANMAEYRDPETGGHIKRTRMYVKLLAEKMKQHDKYKHFLNDANIDMLYKSAPLHDIGKVGIADKILLKPGRLTDEEFEIMKGHATIGRDVIDISVRKLGKRSFLTIAAEIAYSHHEKWDGSGYPQGLKGDQIPISGRLMALADVYDALISKRIYKPPFSHTKSVDIIRQGIGTQFDPEIVEAFLEINEEFKNIARMFADSQEELDVLEKDDMTG